MEFDQDDQRRREQDEIRRHPLRRAILDTLGREGELSLREITERVEIDPQLPVAVVSYHLTQLQRVGLVDCVGSLYRVV